MKENDFARFLALPKQEQATAFAKTAASLSTEPEYIEKDFWVCYILDTLYNRLPNTHPQLLFKGGTSLSKAFDLIGRFSEDVDLTVDRAALGFTNNKDPIALGELSGKKRRALFEELKTECSNYICNSLANDLASVIGHHCTIQPDENDIDRLTLLVRYPTLYPHTDTSYVQPFARLEGGARSAHNPNTTADITPYIAETVGDGWSFEVQNLRVIEPSRTYLEKLLILHGVHCGYRDEKRLPKGKHRISRHYYDVAMITGTEIGARALADKTLLNEVREHNLIAFRQAWKKFEEAVPGTIKLVPQEELREVINEDYQAMQRMMLKGAPDFGWIMEQVQIAEDAINKC